MNSDLKSHWENIYSSKMGIIVVGFKNTKTSINLIEKYSSNNQFQLLILKWKSRIKKFDRNEYENLTYLDISQEAF